MRHKLHLFIDPETVRVDELRVQVGAYGLHGVRLHGHTITHVRSSNVWRDTMQCHIISTWIQQYGSNHYARACRTLLPFVTYNQVVENGTVAIEGGQTNCMHRFQPQCFRAVELGATCACYLQDGAGGAIEVRRTASECFRDGARRVIQQATNGKVQSHSVNGICHWCCTLTKTSTLIDMHAYGTHGVKMVPQLHRSKHWPHAARHQRWCCLSCIHCTYTTPPITLQYSRTWKYTRLRCTHLEDVFQGIRFHD